jgi:hypothetical protein
MSMRNWSDTILGKVTAKTKIHKKVHAFILLSAMSVLFSVLFFLKVRTSADAAS